MLAMRRLLFRIFGKKNHICLCLYKISWANKTLESGINVASGKFDKNDKRSHLKCANLCSKIYVF